MKNLNLVNKNNTSYLKISPSMYNLRHEVFKKRLDWEVKSVEEQEIDEYDKEDDANYVVVTDNPNNDHVVGCMRLLPTTGRYMLKDTFPEILESEELPIQDDVWEISRFAVKNNVTEKHGLTSFGETTQHLAKGMCDFATQNNISAYVGLTTPQVERLIKNLGLNCVRVGKIKQINDLKVVVVKIIMDKNSIDAVNQKMIEASQK